MTTPLFILKHSGRHVDEFNIGETTGGDLVVVGDLWRDLDPRIEDLLRQKGYETYFSDSLASCDNCYKFCNLYYGDQELPVVINDELFCPNCVRSDFQDEYVELLINDPSIANHLLNDKILESYGFKLFKNDLASGLHPGQNDDPKKIFNAIKDKFNQIIFSIDNVGQFDVHFSIWIKE